MSMPGSEGMNGQMDWQAQQTSATSGLVHRDSRSCLNMDRPGHHRIDSLKERRVEKRSGQQSTLRGLERSMFDQILALFRQHPWGQA